MPVEYTHARRRSTAARLSPAVPPQASGDGRRLLTPRRLVVVENPALPRSSSGFAGVFSRPQGYAARPAWVGIWVVLLFVAFWITRYGSHAGVVAGVALVMLSAVPVLSRLRRDVLDAPGLYGLVTVVFFGLTSLGWLGVPPIPAPGVGPDDVSRALILVAGGLLAFTAGARVAGAVSARPPLQYAVDDQDRRLRNIVVVFGFGAAGTAVGIATGTVGYTSDAGSGLWRLFSQVFVQLAGLGGLAVLACSLQAFGAADRGARQVLPLLIAVQVVIGFAAGFKGQAIMPLVLAVLAFIACSGRVPWRLILATVAATVLVLVPANIVYRSVLRPTPETENRSVQVVAADAQHLLLLRYRLIDHVALIDARTPDTYPYAGGRRYLQLPALVLMPRALWPDKPVLRDSLEFSHTYWQVPATTTTSTPLTQVGDLLRNFGPLGVALGLAAWGMIVGLFTRICVRLRSPRVEMIYLASLITWISVVESDLPQLVAAAARSVPVAILAAWLLVPGRTANEGRVSRLLKDAWVRLTPRQLARRAAADNSPGI